MHHLIEYRLDATAVAVGAGLLDVCADTMVTLVNDITISIAKAANKFFIIDNHLWFKLIDKGNIALFLTSQRYRK